LGVSKTFQLKIGQFLAEVVSENIWGFSWQFGLASIGLVGALSILTSLSATWQVLRQKPLNLLQAV
jgi:predicted lysophospholipase L1 biosynthesis ABC-type transport system permease subunit